MAFWAGVSAWALAGVRVEDPRGCLSAEAVDLEVRAALGDEQVDRLALLARIDDAGAGWVLRIEVAEGDRPLWHKEVPVAPVDCPFLPELIARSVERGLAAIPGWSWAEGRRRRSPDEGAFQLSVSAPRAMRYGVGLAFAIGLPEPFLWEFDVEGWLGEVQPVGTGTAQLFGARLGAGPAVALPALGTTFRLAGRWTAGPVVSTGRAFRSPATTISPRSTAQLDLGWGPPGPVPVRVALRTEVVLVGVAPVDTGTGQRAPEPLVRAGLVLGIAGSLRAGDGGGPGRP